MRGLYSALAHIPHAPGAPPRDEMASAAICST